MNNLYNKIFMPILITSTFIFLLSVEVEGQDMPQAKTPIINKGHSLQTNLYCDGVFDRIEDGKQAVILIEELGEELIIQLNELPFGSKEQTWFNIVKSDDGINIISINENKTKQKAIESMQLMEKLRKEKQDELPHE